MEVAEKAKEKAAAKGEKDRGGAEAKGEKKRKDSGAAAHAAALPQQPDPPAVDNWDRHYEAQQDRQLTSVVAGCIGLVVLAIVLTVFGAC